MFKRIAQDVAAFGAAAVMTFAVLSSIVSIAAPATEQRLLAATPAATQVVVIEAKRLPKV